MSGSVTVPGPGGGGAVTIPASTAQNLTFLQIALNSITGTSLSDTTGGAVSVPGGVGLLALGGEEAATVTGGDSSLRILSGLGGLTYSGSAETIIASGGANSIVATGGVTPYSRLIDVGGNSTVTADNALVQTEGGASSINAGTGNFVVTTGADTINTGAGPNTVAAMGSAGGVTHAGSGDLLWVAAGDSSGVQTIFGGTGNETVFAGPKALLWQGSNPGGSLLFIGDAQAATIIGGSGQETLFGGTGGDVYVMGGTATTHSIVVANAGNYNITGGLGQTDIYANAGSNITLNDDTVGLQNLIVVGGGSETINAAGGSGNHFILGGSNNNSATITGSALGRDQFDFYNQGSLSQGGTFTITNFATNNTFQTLVFLAYGYNPTNVHDGGELASQPDQQIIAGSNHITLSDNTTIILQGYDHLVAFNNFNAVA